MKADAGGRGILSADFADAADGGKEICAICVICGFSRSALRTRHSTLERLFSGIHFGMDDWGNPRRRPKHQEGCEPQRAQIQLGGEGVEEAHGVFRPM
jgi:hypothetical protein